MKWLRGIIIAITMVAGIILINNIKQIADRDANMYVNYEESPAKLKKLVDAHRLFHEKIKITFAGLIDDLKPYLKKDDISQINEIVEAILDQYNNDTNKAEEALAANDIELANNLLARVAKELENIYIIQEMTINFKQKIAPLRIAPAPKQKNNKIFV